MFERHTLSCQIALQSAYVLLVALDFRLTFDPLCCWFVFDIKVLLELQNAKRKKQAKADYEALAQARPSAGPVTAKPSVQRKALVKEVTTPPPHAYPASPPNTLSF